MALKGINVSWTVSLVSFSHCIGICINRLQLIGRLREMSRFAFLTAEKLRCSVFVMQLVFCKHFGILKRIMSTASTFEYPLVFLM